MDAELNNICGDGSKLAALMAKGLEAGTIEETETLTQLSELSSRLLCRNRSREAARLFARTLLGDKDPMDPAVDAAAKVFLPSYFRHTSSGEEDASQMWVCKLFLHELPAAPGSTLCARFSLTEHADPAADPDADEEPQYDLSLTVMQVAPYKVGTARFALTFALADKRAAEAGEFALDDAQRARIGELQQMLGLTSSRWTPVGVLGVLLAAVGCAQMETNPCFTELLRAAREAHREELLASAGFF